MSIDLYCGTCRPLYSRYESRQRRRERIIKKENEEHTIPIGSFLCLHAPPTQSTFLLKSATHIDLSEPFELEYDTSIGVEGYRKWSEERSKHPLAMGCPMVSNATHSSIVHLSPCPPNPTEDTFSSDIFLLDRIHERPKILLSLSLRLQRDDSWRSEPSVEDQPLLLACIKRQLAGKALLYNQQYAMTTRFTIMILGKTYRLCVKDLVAQQQKDAYLFLVLPSTRITIHDNKDTKLLTPIVKEASKLTKTARVLTEALQILENSLEGTTTYIPRTFLLSGPPGTGKTYSVRQAVEYSQCELVSIRGSEITDLETLQRYFLRRSGRSNRPTLIFLDECDALLTAGQTGYHMESMLGYLLDNLDPLSVVVAATNRVDSIPASLRRPGRFDREIPFAPPDVNTREDLLLDLMKNTESLYFDVSASERRSLAQMCVGYVPADLAALVRKATMIALEVDGGFPTSVTPEHLKEAMEEVGASALRDAALSAPPATTWDDIAGDPGGAKTLLRQAIEWPRLKEREFKALGLVPPRGILLYGPPGCAKTSLARAAAGASGVSFLSLAPADVYASSFVGDAEAVVRRSFTLARSAAPCILFFDEIDAIIGSSANNVTMDRGSSAEARVMSTFLNEMDGVDGSWKDGVLVLGATNRPWTLDAALLRPGRFDKIIHVPPPDYQGRHSILERQFEHWESFEEGDLQLWAERTEGLTGAEIVGACREASLRIFQERATARHTHHLEKALSNIKPILKDPHVMEEFRVFEARCRN